MIYNQIVTWTAFAILAIFKLEGEALLLIRMFLNGRPPGVDSNFKCVAVFMINGSLLFLTEYG